MICLRKSCHFYGNVFVRAKGSLPTPGNMALNLDMANDTIGRVLEDESTGAGVEIPDATWERLLT